MFNNMSLYNNTTHIPNAGLILLQVAQDNFFLFFFLIKKDFILGILEFMFELSEKIQFQCKNHIKHSRVYCWCCNLFACLSSQKKMIK